jgi:hypothetical protein
MRHLSPALGLLLAALPTAALAQVVDLDGPSAGELPPAGLRTTAYAEGAQLGLGAQAVVGRYGGTTYLPIHLQVGGERWVAGARTGYAGVRTVGGRSADLGNLLVEGLWRGQAGALEVAAGAEVHFNPGGQPYSWTQRVDELWPGGGVDAVVQVLKPGQTTWIGRGSLGFHGARRADPVPGAFVRLAATGAVDRALSDRVGLTGEATLAFYEVSPVDLVGLLRVDPLAGLRLRGGVVLPVGSWVGLSPGLLPPGLHEATFLLDLRVAPAP